MTSPIKVYYRTLHTDILQSTACTSLCRMKNSSKVTVPLGLGQKYCPTAPPTLLRVRAVPLSPGAASPAPSVLAATRAQPVGVNRPPHGLQACHPRPHPATHSPIPGRPRDPGAALRTRQCRRVPAGAGPGSARGPPGAALGARSPRSPARPGGPAGAPARAPAPAGRWRRPRRPVHWRG